MLKTSLFLKNDKARIYPKQAKLTTTIFVEDKSRLNE
jgi:hypothetical protein